MELPEIKITPLGGVEDENNINSSLTGSSTLVEVKYLDKNNVQKIHKFLIDVGMLQGIEESENIYLNKKLHISQVQLKADEIDDIFITHAHSDHLLIAPLYVKEGFEGEFHTHSHTKKVSKHMFEDAVKIQKINLKKQSSLNKISYNSPALKDVRKSLSRLSKRTGRDMSHLESELIEMFDDDSHNSIRKDLSGNHTTYNEDDCINTIIKMKGYDYKKWYKLSNNGEIEFKLYNAAHIKGSATIVFRVKNYNSPESECKQIGFSGDLGRFNPVIKLEKHPEIPEEKLDFFMIESTYGDKHHNDVKRALDILYKEINKVIHKRGKVIIPTFAQHRLPQMIEVLYNAIEKGLIPPDTKIICDTPLGKKLLADYISNNVEGYKHLHKAQFIDYNDREKILSQKKIIILSTSGMMDGGPIFNYLTLLEESKNLLIACNYMTEGSLGHKIIIEKDKLVEYSQKDSDEIKEINIKAKVVRLNGFSGHADQKDLKYYINSINFNENATLLINHGVKQRSMIGLKNELERKNIASNINIVLAEIGHEIIV
jgi:metallo-beta-lactamase family protein